MTQDKIDAAFMAGFITATYGMIGATVPEYIKPFIDRAVAGVAGKPESMVVAGLRIGESETTAPRVKLLDGQKKKGHDARPDSLPNFPCVMVPIVDGVVLEKKKRVWSEAHKEAMRQSMKKRIAAGFVPGKRNPVKITGSLIARPSSGLLDSDEDNEEGNF